MLGITPGSNPSGLISLAITMNASGATMTNRNKKLLVVNMFYWVAAVLARPLASLLPTSSGLPPKVFELLIPLFYVMLAFGSTAMFARALSEGEQP
jgi:hypothetical protein